MLPHYCCCYCYYYYYCYCYYVKPHLPELCKAIYEGDRLMGEKWRCSECWATIEQLVKASTGINNI